jgi:putative tryptophan/tyrosine transport system substrate-binding protein
MKRREFITLLGCTAIVWPVAARAQQAERMKRIGVLMGIANDAEGQARLASFLRGLQELGWTDGRNVQIETRWAAGKADAARTYAAELVELAPDVTLTATTVAFAAMQRATQSVPIVFVQVVEPVKSGLVSSLAHPNGNATGFTSFEYAIAGKWLATIKEIVPSVVRVAVVHSPDDPSSAGYLREGEALARVLGVELVPVGAHNIAEVERALDEFARKPNGGLIALPNAFTAAYREQIVALAALHHLPAVYPLRYYATSGGLVSYGFDNIELYRRAASYVDRILKGAKPSDLPIQQPIKFELVVNLKAAKSLGLTLPESFLVRADEVIE